MSGQLAAILCTRTSTATLATPITRSLASPATRCLATSVTRCLAAPVTRCIATPVTRSLHTTQICCLRKAPQSRNRIFGVDLTYIPWPSYLIKAMIRRRYKKEDLGPTEEYRKSLFHRISILYAVLTWTGMGIALYIYLQPKTEEMLAQEKKYDELPHQEDINKGGAMYWIQALKSPDEMQDLRKMKVIKFSGMTYKGTEDVTIKVKEIGQEINSRNDGKSDDFFLRQKLEIPSEDEGGPTNQELREQFKEEGRDFELELDYANIRAKRRTNYNPDGTVGSFVSKEDIKRGNMVGQDVIAQ